MNKIYYANSLRHHGVEGQKWGIRRFQNPDGTLTEEGKKRYSRKVLGVFDRTLPNKNKSKKLGEVENRREEARNAVKLYGGKHAAMTEVSEDYNKRIRANAWKGLGLSTPAVALTALGFAAESIGALALGAVPLAMITIGHSIATASLIKNKKLANSYINDLVIDKKKTSVDE